MSSDVDSGPISSDEEDQLLLDRERLTELSLKYSIHTQRIEVLEEKITTLAILFFIFVISFASLVYVVLDHNCD